MKFVDASPAVLLLLLLVCCCAAAAAVLLLPLLLLLLPIRPSVLSLGHHAPAASSGHAAEDLSAATPQG
jgi:hypothetical protein